jgi:UDP-2-acetamido-2-deoxy-ribo-hexuluronate aminotransferase
MQFIDLKTQYAQLRQQINDRIQTVLDHGQYILGPEVDELERRLAAYVGTTHCVTLSSGSDALLVAMLALGVGAGDEVITTPFSFIATAEMIALFGAVPVFVDIDPLTYNIDPECIAKAITSRTKAIMPVSLYGHCAAFKEINTLAEQHGLPVIEDAAQSFGATYHGVRSCGLTTIGCTSFFPSKPLGGYGDSGACFTNDSELAARMQYIRVHGQDRRYHHPYLGINGRMDSLQAAVLLAKLDSFPDEVAQRGRLGARYTEQLTRLPHIMTPTLAPGNTSVYAQYTIQVQDRDAVSAALNERSIPTAVHYSVPLHRQPVFAGLGYRSGSLPVAEAAAARVLSLPMHPFLSEADQERVITALQKATTQSK